MRRPRLIELPVADVAAAARFYAAALPIESVQETAQGSVEVWLVGGALALHVVDERDHAPSRADRDQIERGRTPRMEIFADDVDARAARLVRLGARVAARYAPDGAGGAREIGEAEGPAHAALVVDPWGHAWLVTRPDDEEDLP
jgi:hypothetical protein